MEWQIPSTLTRFSLSLSLSPLPPPLSLPSSFFFSPLVRVSFCVPITYYWECTKRMAMPNASAVLFIVAKAKHFLIFFNQPQILVWEYICLTAPLPSHAVSLCSGDSSPTPGAVGQAAC
jgi:hypothetical protein